MNDDLAKFVQTLRAYADWLEAHPTATVSSPYEEKAGQWLVLDPRGWTPDGMAEIARAIGGRWEKSVDDSYFWLRQEILPGITYGIYASRQAVCERVVVGTEKVEVPDPRAPKVTVERDVIEWRCPDSILATGVAS